MNILNTLTGAVKKHHTNPYVLIAGGLALTIAGSTAGFSLAQGGSLSASVAEGVAKRDAENIATTDNVRDSIVGIAGDQANTAQGGAGNSWAGTVISLGTVPVQPTREGSIVSWMVKIGDRVSAGQPIAKLSEPPAMPDLTIMLATEAKMLAEKKAQADTTRQFTVKNNAQLKTQLAAFEQSANDSSKLLSTTVSNAAPANARISIEQANAAVQAMRNELRSFLDQMVAEHVNTITNTHVPALYRTGSLHAGYGQLDINTRTAVEDGLLILITRLNDKNSLPIDEAKQYLASAVRLAHSTVYGEGVEDIRSMMKMDQENFLEMVSEFKDAEAEASMKATDYQAMNIEAGRMLVTDRRMIEEKIAENEKMAAMADAEAKAAEVSYAAVLQTSKGGLYVVSPIAGIVSTIDRNVGEFAEPGMPIARVTAVSGDKRPFIRFRIPGNIRPPQAGTVLKAVRPGFSENVSEVRVTGVGASLDSGGMYMADASFSMLTNWPIDASVRVIAPSSATGISVRLSALSWNQSGEPQIWAVSPAGRIYAKRVSLGRTLGTYVEVYGGLSVGDQYILKPTAVVHEDMPLDELLPKEQMNMEMSDDGDKTGSSEHDDMPGM